MEAVGFAESQPTLPESQYYVLLNSVLDSQYEDYYVYAMKKGDVWHEVFNEDVGNPDLIRFRSNAGFELTVPKGPNSVKDFLQKALTDGYDIFVTNSTSPAQGELFRIFPEEVLKIAIDNFAEWESAGLSPELLPDDTQEKILNAIISTDKKKGYRYTDSRGIRYEVLAYAETEPTTRVLLPGASGRYYTTSRDYSLPKNANPVTKAIQTPGAMLVLIREGFPRIKENMIYLQSAAKSSQPPVSPTTQGTISPDLAALLQPILVQPSAGVSAPANPSPALTTNPVPLASPPLASPPPAPDANPVPLGGYPEDIQIWKDRGFEHFFDPELVAKIVQTPYTTTDDFPEVPHLRKLLHEASTNILDQIKKITDSRKSAQLQSEFSEFIAWIETSLTTLVTTRDMRNLMPMIQKGDEVNAWLYQHSLEIAGATPQNFEKTRASYNRYANQVNLLLRRLSNMIDPFAIRNAPYTNNGYRVIAVILQDKSVLRPYTDEQGRHVYRDDANTKRLKPDANPFLEIQELGSATFAMVPNNPKHYFDHEMFFIKYEESGWKNNGLTYVAMEKGFKELIQKTIALNDLSAAHQHTLPSGERYEILAYIHHPPNVRVYLPETSGRYRSVDDDFLEDVDPVTLAAQNPGAVLAVIREGQPRTLENIFYVTAIAQGSRTSRTDMLLDRPFSPVRVLAPSEVTGRDQIESQNIARHGSRALRRDTDYPVESFEVPNAAFVFRIGAGSRTEVPAGATDHSAALEAWAEQIEAHAQHLERRIESGQKPGQVTLDLDEYIADGLVASSDKSFVLGLPQVASAARRLTDLGFRVHLAAASPQTLRFALSEEKSLSSFVAPPAADRRNIRLLKPQSARQFTPGPNEGALVVTVFEQVSGKVVVRDAIGELFAAAEMSLVAGESEQVDVELARRIADRKGLEVSVQGAVRGTLTALAHGRLDEGTIANAERFVTLPSRLVSDLVEAAYLRALLGRNFDVSA